MEVLKKYKEQILFHLALNGAVMVFVTFASFVHYPLDDFNGYAFYLAHFAVLQFSVFGFLYLLSLNKWIFRIFFPPLFLFFSMVAYWVYFQDIAISHAMVQVTMETKPDIAIDLVTLPLTAYLVLSAAVALLLLRMHQKTTGNNWKSPLTLFALAGMACFFGVENYKFGAFTRRLPYNVIAAVNDYSEMPKLILKPVAKSLKAETDSLNVVFILGETVRADHMQLNGYARATNPILSKRTNLISFPNAYTPMTYTAVSVPQIMTDAAFGDENDKPCHSLVAVLNHADIPTGWIGNQTPEKSYEVFIGQSRFHKIIDPLHSDLSFNKAYDENLLPPFIRVFKPYQNQFTTIHMMGSHWWYESRYPDAFRVFKPVIGSKHIPSNTRDQMVNSYDNSILYLDHFIDQVIRQVERYDSNTLVIYLSDHGELLGEDGQWLHAQNRKEVTNPAMLIWYSGGFKKKYPQIVSSLEANRMKQTNLDFFFPTILDLFGIKGQPYDHGKSLLKAK